MIVLRCLLKSTCSHYGSCLELPAAVHLYSASSVRTRAAFLLNSFLLSVICLSKKKWLSSRRRSYSGVQVLICHPYSLLPNMQRTWPTALLQEHVCRTFSQRQHRPYSHSVKSTFFLACRPHETFTIVDKTCVPCNV